MLVAKKMGRKIGISFAVITSLCTYSPHVFIDAIFDHAKPMQTKDLAIFLREKLQLSRKTSHMYMCIGIPGAEKIFAGQLRRKQQNINSFCCLLHTCRKLQIVLSLSLNAKHGV